MRVKILEHSDPGLVGVEGVVVDETAKTLLIETGDGRRKRVFKEHGVYLFYLPRRGKVIIRGVQILGRPEYRLKNIAQ